MLSFSVHTQKNADEGGYPRGRGEAKPEFSSLPSPPCKSSHCERSPPTPEKSHTNGGAAHAGLEAGAACARASAPNPLPPTCALPGGGGARPSGLAGRRAGSPQLPSPCVWGEGAWAASGTFHSQREPGGGGGNLPSPAPVSILPLRRSIHEVSPPPRCSRRDPEPRGAASLPPEAGGGQKRFPLPPERGAAARAGAGNSRGLSGWRSPSGERSPAFLLPGPGGGVGHGEGLAARSGRVGGWGAAASASCSRAAAGGQRGPRRPLLLRLPASREPRSAPARGPRPPGRPRLLPSHTPRAARAPGLPGAPPPSLHTLLRPGCCGRRRRRPPASLSPGQVLLLLRLSFHTHARARAPWLAGPPPFLQPSSPSQSFKRRRRGWAED